MWLYSPVCVAKDRFSHNEAHIHVESLNVEAKAKSKQRSATSANRTKVPPSKPKKVITKITNSHNKRTYGKPNEQLFPPKCGTQLPKSKRKAMNRNWYNQKANPALNTKAGNKQTPQTDKIQREQIANRVGSYLPKGGHPATQTELKE